jgi:hypothetical protein
VPSDVADDAGPPRSEALVEQRNWTETGREITNILAILAIFLKIKYFSKSIDN